jgi:hypothetical protein
MTPQERLLHNRYNTLRFKMQEAMKNGNTPMYKAYKDKMKTIRMVISTLNIHIDGINREVKK